jgi:hypothetical protein
MRKHSKFDLRFMARACLCAAICMIWLGVPATAQHPAVSTHNVPGGGSGWVTVWQGSPTPGGTFWSPGCPSDVGLINQTVRNIVYPTAGGGSVRIRLSNAGGLKPLDVGSASIAKSSGGTAALAGAATALSFGGQKSILIGAGGEAFSDPVDIEVSAYEALAISVYLPTATGPATQHYFANQDNWLTSGDQTMVAQAAAFTDDISCWMFVRSGVDVEGAGNLAGILVVLGDSITEGANSTPHVNQRYTDYLARRLLARPGTKLAVANAGIIGNELLTVRTDFIQFGYPAPARLAGVPRA